MVYIFNSYPALIFYPMPFFIFCQENGNILDRKFPFKSHYD